MYCDRCKEYKGIYKCLLCEQFGCSFCEYTKPEPVILTLPVTLIPLDSYCDHSTICEIELPSKA